MTHARTGPDTQRAQTHNHTQNSNSRCHERTPDKPHVHTHTQTSRTKNDAINRRHRPASQPHSLSHPHARARWPVEPSPARAPPTSPPAPPPAGPSRPAASEKGYDHEVDGEEAGLELRREPRGIFARALPPAALVAAPGQGKPAIQDASVRASHLPAGGGTHEQR